MQPDSWYGTNKIISEVHKLTPQTTLYWTIHLLTMMNNMYISIHLANKVIFKMKAKYKILTVNIKKTACKSWTNQQFCTSVKMAK